MCWGYTMFLSTNEIVEPRQFHDRVVATRSLRSASIGYALCSEDCATRLN